MPFRVRLRDSVPRQLRRTFGALAATASALCFAQAPSADACIDEFIQRFETTLCTVPLPRSCAARRVILPIESRNPVSAGRTTSLQVGPRGSLVDRARWNLP